MALCLSNRLPWKISKDSSLVRLEKSVFSPKNSTSFWRVLNLASRLSWSV